MLKNLLRAGVLSLGLAFLGIEAATSYTSNTTGTTLNGVLDALTDLVTSGYKCTQTLTRPNNTTSYTANDVVGDNAQGPITFTGCARSAGGEIMLVSAELEIDASAVISGETSYALYLFNVTPPSALADNAAFDIASGDRASFIGKVNLGTPVDEGSTLYIKTDQMSAMFSATGSSIFGYLVTVGAYQPTAQRVYKVTLHFAAF